MPDPRPRPLLVFRIDPRKGGRVTPYLTDGRECIALRPLPRRFGSLGEAQASLADRFPRSTLVAADAGSLPIPKEASR